MITVQPVEYIIKGNEQFPGSPLPVLYYEQALKIPTIFPTKTIKTLFKNNNWSNNWRGGIFTFHHYHTITHEAMAVIAGRTMIQLGATTG